MDFAAVTEAPSNGDAPLEAATEAAGVLDGWGTGTMDGSPTDALADCPPRPAAAYLVACHWDWSKSSKPYPVYKVDLAHSRTKRKRLRRAGRLATVAGGKTFTSMRTWIVGVGGDPSHTVIFDTEKKKVIHGPSLKSAKWCPVLIAVGDRVYAMSMTPSWIADPDFPPWFEVLDLSGARVVTVDDDSHLEGCSWRDLPHPPCFPWKISPLGYTTLPVVVLMSYAVLDPYILVSFNQQWGTYAFDTNSCQWHKADDNRLPFVGCATLVFGSVFLGQSKKNGPLNAYSIHVASASDESHALKLSITVLPLKYMGHEVNPGPCFSYLDSGRFCSLSFSLDKCSVTLDPKNLEPYPKTAHVNLTTYQIDNYSLMEDPELLLASKPEIAISTHWEQAFEISSSHGFSPFPFTLLSI